MEYDRDTACHMAEAMRKDIPRRTAIPISRSFLSRRTADDEKPSLAQIVAKSKRAGNVPLLLYLALTWRCSAGNFDTDKPAAAWARTLGLKDPQGQGARRIRNALGILAELKLITLDKRQQGHSPKITLLSSHGDGTPYQLPYDEYHEHHDDSNSYFQIPIALWTSGIIQGLSTSAIAMLLILLAAGAQNRAYCFPGNVFEQRYAISPSTRTRGTRQLKQALLLETTPRPIHEGEDFGQFERQNIRLWYSLTIPAIAKHVKYRNKSGA